ncbi:MAG: ribonuclease P protein component 4 [Candidatus Bathyarchaeia archaeon]
MSAREIASQRVHRLFQLAMEIIHTDPKLAQRYVEIARNIAMRTRLHLPREYNRMVCRHCKNFILPGVNCRVRIQPRRETHAVITCLICGGHMRIPLKGRKRG